ncbi:MAG: disulfide bond formation protein DsbA [Rhodospirillales bacterium]|nr:disulfide bond formation protein DsbA [Rhodospirillales bacterium]
MPKPIEIDFVSDVVCPWCVIGLRELETALTRLADVVTPNIQLQPFELNPTMPREGQGMAEHMMQKFGRSMDQSGGVREALQARAADVGFTIAMNENSRIYNSFDAHRLLHWAGLEDGRSALEEGRAGLQGRQVALKHALFGAYFTENLNIADYDILVAKAATVGLDGAQARDVLESGRYKAEVLETEEIWKKSGISSVPSIVVNRKYLISGGQTAAVFEESLRRIAAETP